MSAPSPTEFTDPIAADRPTENFGGDVPTVAPRPALPRVPGYELLHELGRGGMGVVYLARDLRLDRYAAVKMVLGGGAASDEYLQRFRAEAQAVAALRHPGIVQIYETGELDGLPYFALEYCDGGTLDRRLRDGPVPPRAAAELIRHVADAVASAHAAGIIHRDLKPSNILLSVAPDAVNSKNQEPNSNRSGSSKNQERNSNRSGSSKNQEPNSNPNSDWNLVPGSWNLPKVSDFGLAKRGGDSNLTATGIAVGTPSYMSPEQANLGPVGPASDIYALGAVLYECLTARPPFVGGDALDTLLQVRLIDPIPPSRFRPSVPADLETICLKCLAKDPARRYATAGDLAADLTNWLDGRPIVARPAGPVERLVKWARRRPSLAAALAATLVMLVAGTVVSTYFAVKATAQAGRAERAGLELRRQLGRAHFDRGLGLADQGKIAEALHAFLAALREVEGDGDAEFERVVRINLAEWGRLVPTPRRFVPLRPGEKSRQPTCLAVSPDGRTLAIGYRIGPVEFWDFPALRRRPERIELPPAAFATALAFRPDGRQLAVAVRGYDNSPDDLHGVVLWDVDRRAAEGGLLQYHRAAPVNLSYRPDGRELAVGYIHQPPCVWDLPSRRVRLPLAWPGKLATTRSQRTRAAFAPDGRTLTCSLAPDGDNLGGRSWLCSADDGAIVGEVASSTHSLYVGEFAPDGRSYPVLDRVEGLSLFDAATGDILARRPNVGDANAAAFSPDGRRILTTNDQMVEVLDAAGLRPACEPLPQSDRVCAFAWTGDGDAAVTVADDGTLAAWDLPRTRSGSPGMMRLTAGAERIRGDALLRYPLAAIDPATGTTAAAVQPFDGSGGMCHTRLTDARTGRPVAPPVVSGRWWVSALALAADGRTGATAVSRHGIGGEVLVWDARTGRELAAPIVQSNMPLGLALRADGRQIAVGNFHELLRLYHADGRPVAPTVRPPDIPLSLAFSPDGAALACGVDRDRRQVPAAVLYEIGDPLRRKATLKHEAMVRQVKFSPDGRVLATAALQNVRLWDARTGEPLSPNLIHPNGCTDLAFRGDGRVLLTGSLDKKMRLWEVPDGRTVAGRAIVHAAAVQSVAWSPDGRTVVAGCADGTVRAWDVATRRPLGPPWVMASPVDHVAALTDGRGFVAVDLNGDTRFWPTAAEPTAEPLDELQARVEALTGLTRDAGGDVTRLTVAEWANRLEAGGATRPLAEPIDPAEWHDRMATDTRIGGDRFAATWHLERLERLRPADGFVPARLGRIHAEAADWAKAAAAFDRAAKLATADELATWHRQNAADAAVDKRFALARWHLDRAKLLQPDDAALAAERARVLARLGEWPASVAEWDRALVGRPEQWLWRLERADARGELGDAAGRDADRDAAVMTGAGLEDAVKLMDEYAEAGRWADVARLGSVLPERGLVPLALAKLRAVAALKIGDAAGYRQVSAAFRLPRADDADDNKRWLVQLHTLGPDAVDDWQRYLNVVVQLPNANDRAAVYFRAGRYADVVTTTDTAGHELEPIGRAFRAMALARLGRADAARAEWAKAKEMAATPVNWLERAVWELLSAEAGRWIGGQ